MGAAQHGCAVALKSAAIEDPVREARLLLGFVLGGGPERVLADRDAVLSETQSSALAGVLAQRCQRVPMAQILGLREFWSLELKVTAATLTPRPDTETLVEAVLDHVAGGPKTILDLGTGTGCILMALLSEWPGAVGLGVDVSADALAVARHNAVRLGLAERLDLVVGDWTVEGWSKSLGGPFSVVVSNPPYIASAEIDGLDADVRCHEPLSALDGGGDGLHAYRTIIQGLNDLLAVGGVAGFEVGIGQALAVEALARSVGLTVLETRCDLGGISRAVVVQKVHGNGCLGANK